MSSYVALGDYSGADTPDYSAYVLSDEAANTTAVDGSSLVGTAPRCSRRSLFGMIFALAVVVLALSIVIGTSDGSSSSGSDDSAPPSNTPPARAPLPASAERVIDDISSTLLAPNLGDLDPCDNFYELACSGLRDHFATSTPASYSNLFVHSMSVVKNSTQAQLDEILHSGLPVLNPYFQACMDEATIAAQPWHTDLDVYLDAIAAVSDAAGLLRTLGMLQQAGHANTAFFGFDAVNDFKLGFTQPLRFSLLPGGMTLDYPSQYNDPNQVAAARAAMERAFTAMGEADPSAAAGKVIDLEKLLAPVFVPATISSIVDRVIVKPADFPLDLASYTSGLGVTQVLDEVQYIGPDFFTTVRDIITSPLADWDTIRTYLRWHLVLGNLNRLPPSFRSSSKLAFAHFSPTKPRAFAADVHRPYHERLAEHHAEQKLLAELATSDRALYCQRDVSNVLSDLLAHFWTLAAYDERNGDAAAALADHVREQMRTHIQSRDWLDEETRNNALQKLSKLKVIVGNDGGWINYDDLRFESGSFVGRFSEVSARNTRKLLASIGSVMDRSHFADRSTIFVNTAYYSPVANTANLVPGLLKMPFFSHEWPQLLNTPYSVVIGHEFTHGFDSNGRHFAQDGSYRDWWSESANNAFEDRIKCVEDQFDDLAAEVYNLPKGLGAQTLGENIADLAGVQFAWNIYKQYGQLEDQLSPLFTNDQLFFVLYASIWCANPTQDSLNAYLAHNVHAPPRFRVNAPLANLPMFAEAFNCPASSKMGRSLTNKRCEVW